MIALGIELPDGYEPEESEPELFPVEHENWNAVMAFQGLFSQWNVSGTGHVIGLNYPGVESMMRLNRVPTALRAELFADLQIMERAALQVFRESTRAKNTDE